jgi:xylulokinase
MEGIAMNLGCVLTVLKEFCKLEDRMLIVGGGSKSALWRQIFADVFDMEIMKTNVGQDAGSLGAAALGAVGIGLWDGLERIDEVHRIESQEWPIGANVSTYNKMLTAFELQRKHQAELGDFIHGLGTEHLSPL